MLIKKGTHSLWVAVALLNYRCRGSHLAYLHVLCLLCSEAAWQVSIFECLVAALLSFPLISSPAFMVLLLHLLRKDSHQRACFRPLGFAHAFSIRFRRRRSFERVGGDWSPGVSHCFRWEDFVYVDWVLPRPHRSFVCQSRSFCFLVLRCRRSRPWTFSSSFAHPFRASDFSALLFFCRNLPTIAFGFIAHCFPLLENLVL